MRMRLLYESIPARSWEKPGTQAPSEVRAGRGCDRDVAAAPAHNKRAALRARARREHHVGRPRR